MLDVLSSKRLTLRQGACQHKVRFLRSARPLSAMTFSTLHPNYITAVLIQSYCTLEYGTHHQSPIPRPRDTFHGQSLRRSSAKQQRSQTRPPVSIPGMLPSTHTAVKIRTVAKGAEEGSALALIPPRLESRRAPCAATPQEAAEQTDRSERRHATQ